MTSQLNWADPCRYAAGLGSEKNLVFLHSGMAPGRYSILAWGLAEKIETLEKLESKLSADKNKFENCWFGFLGYGLRTSFEKLPKSKTSYINLPDILMMRFKNILVFDHHKKTITSYGGDIPGSQQLSNVALPTINKLESNISDEEYIEKVGIILERIKAGELYQANLTRKFYGEFKTKPDSFALFLKLAEISPAPYSAYLRLGDIAIVSASPEKFLTIENKFATTSPIKGTLASEEPAELLANSAKDKAENLMIVDLMRNDLSRACREVKVEKLYEITSYAKYHHMSSTISGKVETGALDVVKACFPPGSMTGAPKIQAMKLCNELENIERGVYSGAIGYFGGDGSCDLSVVIRTVIIKGKIFEFQVGGGIVADSLPEKELEEAYVKASAIMEALKIKA